MAGRGTDIELDAAARAAGGLHVLSCQDNPSRRLDRQLAGRAGRHGDVGSEEAWLFQRISHAGAQHGEATLPGWTLSLLDNHTPARLAQAIKRWAQRLEERRRAAWRRELLRQDRHRERRLSFAQPLA
jgi:preprotein translocase subunit SecA